MKFKVMRERLIEPLQTVVGVVERRQTLAILANLLMIVSKENLSLTGTDQEVEISARIDDLEVEETGSTTIPARKLLDIVRSLPEGSEISIRREGERVTTESGRFKSHLAILPVADFPNISLEQPLVSFMLAREKAAKLLDKTSFAMAQQDVRYFFNGMLMEIGHDAVKSVATNGQRLATTFVSAENEAEQAQFIVPRKGVFELSRILDNAEGPVHFAFTANHMQAECGNSKLISKLIDGAFPDYQQAIPDPGSKKLIANRVEVRDALTRTAILSNQTYRIIRLSLSKNLLGMHTNNPSQEEAEESVTVEYDGEDLDIGFNVGYLIDVLSVMDAEQVEFSLTDANSAALMRDPEDADSLFVVSPMKL